MTREPTSEAERGKWRSSLWEWVMGALFGVNVWLVMEVLLRH